MGKVLPTLSSSGWVDDPVGTMEKLFVYFLSSNSNQSVTYNGNVYSLRSILAEADDVYKVKAEIERALGSLYRPFFKQTTVSVTIENLDSNGYTPLNISIETIDDNNIKRTLDNVLKTNNSVLENYNELISKYCFRYKKE